MLFFCFCYFYITTFVVSVTGAGLQQSQYTGQAPAEPSTYHHHQLVPYSHSDQTAEEVRRASWPPPPGPVGTSARYSETVNQPPPSPPLSPERRKRKDQVWGRWKVEEQRTRDVMRTHLIVPVTAANAVIGLSKAGVGSLRASHSSTASNDEITMAKGRWKNAKQDAKTTLKNQWNKVRTVYHDSMNVRSKIKEDYDSVRHGRSPFHFPNEYGKQKEREARKKHIEENNEIYQEAHQDQKRLRNPPFPPHPAYQEGRIYPPPSSS